MRKSVFLLGLVSSLCFGQNKGEVEKGIYNVQVGTFGAWVNTEQRLANHFALRGEMGVTPTRYVGNGTVWHLDAILEPRYYYNISKRAEKGKETEKNSADFVTLGIKYNTGVMVSNKNLGTEKSISFVPKWGIRRSLGNGFHYEAGAGFGFRHEFGGGSFGQANYAEIDLHLRIGYTF